MKRMLLRIAALLILAAATPPHTIQFAYAGGALPAENRASLERSVSVAIPAGVEARVIVIDREVAAETPPIRPAGRRRDL